ncbi:MAG: helix-turn-helix domain-containing protein [Nitrososphaerota archaeon]|jgi:transcriptional regulator with XRE-family HTH domain|nr:helix-turn-helix domain-containing protein [Nitrososphaerota archaeon]
MNIVERILGLIERNGITAAHLLRETKLHSTTISQWRKGVYKPSADAILKIAAYFGVSTDFLLTGKEFVDADIQNSTGIKMPVELQKIFVDAQENKFDMTQAELNEVADYINFIKLKREKKKEKHQKKTRATPDK